MGIFDGYLFLSDMDGTLSDREHISQENAEAIRYFQSEGGLFTMATGRSPDYLHKFEDKVIPNCPVIAVNGTVIYDLAKEKLLFSSCLDDQAAEPAVYAENNYDSFLAASTTYDFREWAAIYKATDPGTFAEHAAGLPQPWYKLIIIVKAEDSSQMLADLRSRFGHRYKFERSWPEGIEMHAISSGKEVCIEHLKKLIGRPIHTVVAAGDYENDLPMIQAADIGYAMGNAVQEVKDAADRITVSCQEHAIAAIIDELKKEILKNGND